MRRVLAKLFALGAIAAAWPMSASAFTCDLTTTGSSCQIGDAWYLQMDQQPTGSDQMSFVRIGDNKQEVQGYNTSFRPVQFNEITDLTHTHDLAVADIPIVEYQGGSYYQFGLDINQTGANPLLSLDQVKVYATNSTNNTNYDTGAGFTNLVYNMDTGGDNWVKLDFSLNHGSGSGDMWMLIPTASLAGFSNVILFSQFGSNFRNNDGYEEWFTTQAPIPEPGTGALLLAGLLGMFGVMRRRIAKS